MELNAKQRQNHQEDFVLDEELVLLANEGDSIALETLINKYKILLELGEILLPNWGR